MPFQQESTVCMPWCNVKPCSSLEDRGLLDDLVAHDELMELNVPFYVKDTLEALHHLHNCNVAHLDLNPWCNVKPCSSLEDRGLLDDLVAHDELMELNVPFYLKDTLEPWCNVKPCSSLEDRGLLDDLVAHDELMELNVPFYLKDTFEALHHLHNCNVAHLDLNPWCNVKPCSSLEDRGLLDDLVAHDELMELNVPFYVKDTLEALHHLHNCNVAHLDLNPWCNVKPCSSLEDRGLLDDLVAHDELMEANLLFYVNNTLEALHHLHTCNVAHLDLNPWCNVKPCSSLEDRGLLDDLVAHDELMELNVPFYVKDILEALRHLHTCNVAHLDLNVNIKQN